MAERRRILELHLPNKNDVRTFHNRQYYAYEDGRIYDAGKRRFLKQQVTQNEGGKPYLKVRLQDDSGKAQPYWSHRVILEAFKGFVQSKPIVNHIDENRTSWNDVRNLEWCDYKYNANYGTHTERATAKNTASGLYQRLVVLKKNSGVYERMKNNGTYKRIGAINQKRSSKPVVEIKPDGSVVHWASAAVAGRNGFEGSTIAKCCRGKLKTHHGSRWMYLFDYEAQKEERQELETLASS